MKQKILSTLFTLLLVGLLFCLPVAAEDTLNETSDTNSTNLDDNESIPENVNLDESELAIPSPIIPIPAPVPCSDYSYGWVSNPNFVVDTSYRNYTDDETDSKDTVPGGFFTLINPSASVPGSAYDLRDIDAVTAVKSQGSYSTCWAFSTMAAAESNAIMKGYASSGTIDLSELQAVYFFFNRNGVTTGTVPDKFQGMTGDYVQRIQKGSFADSVGGNAYWLANQLASGIKQVLNEN